MKLLNVFVSNFGVKRTLPLNNSLVKDLFKQSSLENTNVLINPNNTHFYRINNDHISIDTPSTRELIIPKVDKIIDLPQFIKNIEYNNPLYNNKIIKSVVNTDVSYIDQTTHEKYMFNKLRNDTKNRKRAFTKRGYFRRTRCLNRKLNRLSYAYALQGIDYEILESLEMGEIPDLKNFMK